MNQKDDQYYWYHTMDIPGYGAVKGEWELVKVAENYLGGVDFKNKRVLEVGAASGRLTLELEKLGGAVTSLDIGGDYKPDFLSEQPMDHTEFLRRLNNSHKLMREAFKLKATFMNGTVYDPIPGEFDVSVVGNILLHLRDPFKALYNISKATQDKCIIIESLWSWPVYTLERTLNWMARLPFALAGKDLVPEMTLFFPSMGPKEQCVWWYLSPTFIKRILMLLGFEEEKRIYHDQIFRGKKSPQYTTIMVRKRQGVLMQT